MTRKILSPLLALLLAVPSAQAVPAYPKPIKYTQPDGTVVTIVLKGDEHHNWAETPDGYTLLRDSENFWAFATQDAQGNVFVSSLRYNGKTPAPANTPKKLSPTASSISTKATVRKAKTKLQVGNTFPTTGKRKLLLLLVNYADTNPTYSQADFEKMMNGEAYNGIGSFRDYYLQQSYGQLDIETTVTPWVSLYSAKSVYGSDGAVEIIAEALQKISSSIDLTQFDNDGDGVLDGLAVIHQGKGQEMTASSDDIWSHSSTISGLSVGGVQVNRYTIEPEMLATGEMSNIGVICHEFGHNLGAPDFYDTDYGVNNEYPGTGVWDLLGSGAWNGYYGDRPAGINMWQKIIFNWVTPQLLTENTVIADMPDANEQPVAYKVPTTAEGDYFILENRQASAPFDTPLPGSGLLIYHANESLISQTVEENTLNAAYPQAMYTICAGNQDDPSADVSSYGTVNTNAAPFPGSKNVTAFGDETLPSGKSFNGRQSYFSINNIKEEGGKISFNFEKNTPPPAPENLKAESQKGKVALTWTIEEGASPLHYSVYLNDTLVTITTATEYECADPQRGKLLTYSVDATYANGLTSPTSETSIRVPDNKVTAITASTEGTQVSLRLTTSNKLTRMDGVNFENYTTVSLRADSACFAHRFTATDMLTYKGSKITHVAFIPTLAPSEASYTVQVWESDKTGEAFKLLSQKEVSEFGTLTLREVALDKQVTIIAGREYRVAVLCKAKSKQISFVTDLGPVYDELGNVLITDDGISTCDDALGNFFIYATLSPANPSKATALPDAPEVSDALSDLCFPIGYRIYRDGIECGTTGNSLFVDENVPEGTHTYSVASIYRSDNESESLSTNVTIGTSDIASTQTAPSLLLPVDGGLLVTATVSNLRITDTGGRTLMQLSKATPRLIKLPAGTYVVTASGCESTKFVVW